MCRMPSEESWLGLPVAWLTGNVLKPLRLRGEVDQHSFHEVWAPPSLSHLLVSFSGGNSREGKHPHI